jgi:integrase
VKLNDLTVRRAKPADKAYHLSDGRGLFLLVTPSGAKSWRYKFRFNGAGRTLTYGIYPDVPLSDARDRHADARKVLAAGVDPTVARKAVVHTSFRAVATLWLEHWRVDKSAKHVSVATQRLDTYVYPVLGGLAVGEIDATHLLKMVKPIDANGNGETARRVLEIVGMIFRYGVAHGHAKRNPVSDIKPKDVLKPMVIKNHARVGAAELPGLLRAIEVYRGKVLTRLALKLMALTWPRTAELIGGRWSEINFELRRWDIPEERMKEGRPHIIPLSTQAVETLVLLREVTGSGELMFPGDVDPRQTMSKNTLLEALDRMGYKGRMTGHGFRGIASTVLHENNFAHDHIEIQLAHLVGNQSSAPYNHALYLAQREAMLQWWGDYLERAQRGR